MSKRYLHLVLAGLLGGVSSGSYAAVDQSQADRLGKDLTPTGAEQAANAAGTIPAWTGGETEAPAGWEWGKARHKFWPHQNDAKLLTIDASNVDQYADSLTAGQIASIKTLSGYTMEVYPTQRSCALPQSAYERTKLNAASAKLSSDGNKLEAGVGNAVLFPIPQTAEEVIWNHKMRYMGEGFKMKFLSHISPSKGSDAWVKFYNEWLVDLPFNKPNNQGVADAGGIEAAFVYDTFEPEARIGEKLLYKWKINEPTNAWLYFPGQRRVRRLPTYSYDAPVMGNEGTKVVDEFWMFNGAMDRFDWKLVGKKELIVPYNSFKAYDFTADEASIKNPDHFPRDLVRYERHRVWEIEATVADGKRHTMPTRRYYVDEDSWNILVADHFDAEGKIWRTVEAHPMPVWELDSCVSISHVSHDLQTQRWVVDSTPYGGGRDVEWNYARDGKMNKKHFTVNYLKRSSRR
ncbi:MAG: DUF1329 domain-containing protein [Motiliproteus sp.]